MGISNWAMTPETRPRPGGGWGRAVVALVAGLLCAGALSAAPAIAAASTARSTWVGSAPANGSLSLALPLKANLSGLERFAASVSSPSSPQYGQYDSIANLARRFGAPAAERARVVGYLKSTGASGVKIDVTGLFADATMKVSQAQRLFGTSLADFRTAGVAHGATFMAPASSVRIPAALRDDVTGVVGLNTQPLFGSSTPTVSDAGAFPHAAAAPGSERSDDESGYLQRTGTATGCADAVSLSGFTPNQFLSS
jgi:subtilase family serine protease